MRSAVLLTTRSARIAVKPFVRKPLVLLGGEDSPARIITACVRAMLRTGASSRAVTDFMDDADRTETYFELLEVCNRRCVLRDS